MSSNPGQEDAGVIAIRRMFANAEDVFLPEDMRPVARVTKDTARQNDVSEKSEKSPMSEMSPLSPQPYSNPRWSDLLCELFEERAAILEHDAGLERSHAEFLAAGMIDRRHR